MRWAATLGAAIGLAAWCGCAGLMIHDADTPAQQRAKRWTQVGLTVATLGVFPKVQAEVEHAERVRALETKVEDAAARFRRLWLQRILAARTAAQMTTAFHQPPLSCRPSGARNRICIWSTDALLIRGVEAPVRPSGRVALPLRATTTDQVVIVACEVPADGGARAEDSCDVSFW